jgi:carboxymethylenebutenolidase
MDADTYLALPDTVPAPAIVLLPPIFGIEPVIRDIADRWASRGFVVLALNQFRHEAEPGPMERTPEGRARAMARGKGIDVEVLVDDVRAAIDSLRAMPACNGKVAVAGFCFGGRYAFIAAARLPVEAAAGFHPTQIPLSIADAARVRVPLSLHFGADDPLTPKDDVDAIVAALRHRPDADIVVYPGATHNFAVPGVPGYDPAVAELSEQRAFTLFDRLKGAR